MSKIPPAMWEKPDAFADTPGEEATSPPEGVIDDIVGHKRADNHGEHQHGPECDHASEQHGDHVDYLHDGARHFSHEGHWDTHE